MLIIEPVETNRILLRELTHSDLEDVYKIKSDLNVVKYLTWGPNSKEETRRSLIKQISFQSDDNRQMFVLAVMLKQTSQVIGNALLMIKDEDCETAEIGYFINSQFWKNGYGKEIVEGLLQLGFSRIKLHRIYASCDTENTSSINILKKLGFRQEAHFIKNVKVKGEWRDQLLFALLKDEFIEIQKKTFLK